MHVIYHAENIIDANLLKGLLQQQEIVCFVNGEFLQGGIGEVPVSGLVTVSVADSDVAAARRVVTQFEADLAAEDSSLAKLDPEGGGLADDSA